MDHDGEALVTRDRRRIEPKGWRTDPASEGTPTRPNESPLFDKCATMAEKAWRLAKSTFFDSVCLPAEGGSVESVTSPH